MFHKKGGEGVVDWAETTKNWFRQWLLKITQNGVDEVGGRVVRCISRSLVVFCYRECLCARTYFQTPVSKFRQSVTKYLCVIWFLLNDRPIYGKYMKLFVLRANRCSLHEYQT